MDVNDQGVTTQSTPDESRRTLVLVHLSGSQRGYTHRLSGHEIKIGTGAGELLSAVRRLS